jgi:EAL domain-containing protein (putative c-di-GMP-specific phosphodiesterase class I)
VDTIVQRERLIALRCELGQGDIFAKPLDASAVDAFLLEASKVGRATA